MAIDTAPLDAQCVLGSEEPMDIDQWDVNIAFQPDEATILTSVMAMDWEADVLSVLGDWSGTRVPSIPSPISMVVDQLHPSSPPSPTQLAPTNPTVEDGNLINRVHCAPSPTHLVAEQVPPSPSTQHLAPPAPTMLGSVSPTPSSSLPVIPSSEGIESAGTDEPAEVQRQTQEVPAEQPDTQLPSLVEQSTDTPSVPKIRKQLVFVDKAADDFVRKLALKNAPVFADLADPSAPLLSFHSSRAHAEATSAQPVPTVSNTCKASGSILKLWN
jgi:hypothetical protein